LIETLIILAALVIVIVAFLMYHSSAPWGLKLTAFPALIAMIYFAANVYISHLGAPINAIPKGDFQYVHHQSGEGGEVIYLWVFTVERGQRLHSVPYTREIMEQLEEAKGRAEEGNDEYGQFNEDGNDFDYEQVDEPHETEEGFTK